MRVQNAPAWLRFSRTEQPIGPIAAGEERVATITFSVDHSAPVRQEQTLTFIIGNARGESWTKEITVAVAAPERFELFQNYPNPFNPTTTISYQLPVASCISLKIFNLLGQEVATLVEGEQLAGLHQATWEARGIASGVYVYQLVARFSDGSRSVSRRMMAFVK
jgi:hypothetical protein